MIAILGDSCAGKTSIERELTKLWFNRIISYTTRPIRQSEIQDVDYHFINDNDFQLMLKNDQLAEHTIYNGWCYGIAKEDCINDSIVVVEPVGYRMLKRNNNLNIVSFYIKVEERERVVRMMERGDNVMESFRRIISDQGSFNGIENEVDYIIENQRGKLDEAVKQIYYIIQAKRR